VGGVCFVEVGGGRISFKGNRIMFLELTLVDPSVSVTKLMASFVWLASQASLASQARLLEYSE
jgi:hypothetical protein